MSDEFDEIFDVKDEETEEDSGGKHRAPPEPVVGQLVTPEHGWVEDAKIVNLPETQENPQDIVNAAREKAMRDPAPVQQIPSPSLPGAREVMYSTPMDLSAPDPHAKGPWIQYNGVATVRIMDRFAWAQAGVDSTRYCEWNYLNAKRLPRAIFSDEELQYLLRVDGRFSLEEK